MKEQWKRIEARIDALTLRERAMVFAAAVAVLVAMINLLLLDPLFARQKAASTQIKMEQQQIAAIQQEIEQRVKSRSADPDMAMRERLRVLKMQSEKIHSELIGMQRGLVSPDKMASLLEDILTRNGRLQLVSLKTLPASPLVEAQEEAAAPPKAPVAGPEALATKQADKASVETVYKHGVEIVVQGSYADITNYLTQLEGMPWQLFWAGAALNVDIYPKVSLKLTLFTLSLDKQWLNI